MTQQRTVARWLAGLLVSGTMVAGAVAPAQASIHIVANFHHPGHVMHPADTGWNGT
jgi:hypothetical protein